ncbi:ATPase inhibitor subunit zeta [Microvirga sp. 2MCAF35]|uniref:ATPase inhibitor subunit zeta n=1 Tax=Microvirga sp. 2MCAF35 TaxID=3232987 RepID=UPI003F975CF4
MTNSDDTVKTMLRNKLLGRWAAERLGLTGLDAETYAEGFAKGANDPANSDVFSKIHRDFEAAGIAESDERILNVMTELTLKAGNLIPTAQGDSTSAAAVTLARKLM